MLEGLWNAVLSMQVIIEVLHHFINDLHSHLLRIYDSSARASLDVFELIISRLQRAVRSTPSEALIFNS